MRARERAPHSATHSHTKLGSLGFFARTSVCVRQNKRAREDACAFVCVCARERVCLGMCLSEEEEEEENRVIIPFFV